MSEYCTTESKLERQQAALQEDFHTLESRVYKLEHCVYKTAHSLDFLVDHVARIYEKLNRMEDDGK